MCGLSLPTASYRMFNTADTRAALVGIAERVFADPNAAEFARQQGYDLAERARLGMAAVREWVADPDAFLAQSECQVVAWKP